MAKQNRKQQPVLPQTFRNLIRGAADPFVAVSRIRAGLSPSLYPALIAYLPLVTRSGRGVVEPQFPATIERVKPGYRFFSYVPIERELLWTASWLAPHATKLSQFVKLRTQLANALFIADTDRPLALTNTIEEQLGISLWSIETRIGAMQATQGLEAQKAFVAGVRSIRGNDLVSVLTYYTSQRNEDTVNPFWFRKQFREQLPDWNIDGELKTYLSYRIADHIPSDERSLSAILRHELSSPIVDVFETFIRICTSCVARGDPRLVEGCVRAIMMLEPLIDDNRLRRLLFTTTGTHPETVKGLPQIPAFDALVEGRLDEAANLANEGLSISPENVPLRIALAECAAEGFVNAPNSRATFSDKIQQSLWRVITKPQGFGDALFELVRIADNFRTFGFAASLNEFAHNQISPDPEPDFPRAINAFIYDESYAVPALVFLPAPFRDSLAEMLRERYATSEYCSVQITQSTSTPYTDELASKWSSETRLFVQLTLALDADHFTDALATAEEILRCKSVPVQRVAARAYAYALLRLNELERALDFIVRRAMQDQGVITMLPIGRFVERLDKASIRRFRGKIEMPILLDLFTRFVNDRRGNLRGDAYEDFLLAHGYSRPSELRNAVGLFDRALLVYYLKYVCIPEVMQVSDQYEHSSELEDERIAVCSLLREIDADNASDYEEEVRELTRKQVVHGGVRQIEQSKISIDTEPLRRWAERNLKESFARYQALRTARIAELSSPITTSESRTISKSSSTQELPSLPSDETADLLAVILNTFVRECFSNPLHGLDCYLSMRIRHGALSGQLRSPLEEERIITQRGSDGSEYSRNEHWLHRLGYLDGETTTAIDKRLRAFSKAYDDLIRHFADDSVQLKSTEKKNGLFDTAITETLQLYVLEVGVNSDTTFDGFLDLCFPLFWEIVDKGLKATRNHIETILKRDVNRLFDDLISDLERITSANPVPELYASIRNAQTRAQQALGDVTDWFRQAKQPPARQFSFEEIIDIGVQQVKKLHRDFDPQLTISGPTFLEFLELTRFSDIFFIVFDNIQRHSGCGLRPQVRVEIGLNDNILTINITNEVSRQARSPEAEDRVAKIRRDIEEGSYHKGTRLEGGSGLKKLRNLVRTDSRKQLRFGFTDADEFFVHISLPVGAFMVSSEEFHEDPAR